MGVKLVFVLVAMCSSGAMADLINTFCPVTHKVIEQKNWSEMSGWWYVIKQSEPDEMKCTQIEMLVNRPFLNVTKYHQNPVDRMILETDASGEIPLDPSDDISRVHLYVNRTIKKDAPYDVVIEVLAAEDDFAVVYICHPINPNLSSQSTIILSREPALDPSHETDIAIVLSENDLETYDEFQNITQDCGKIDPNNLDKA